MSAFEALCRLLGLLPERVHILGYETVQSPGITSRWMQDLEPVGGRQLVSGELVELVSTLDPALAFSAAPNARFEILEQDHLLTGFQDDPIVALIGTGAADPEDGFQAVPRETVFAFMEPGQTLAEHVEAYRREHPDDYDTRLLALTDVDAMVSHVVTWWRARRLEDFLDSEFYFVLDLDGTRDGTDRILDVAVGPSGVPVRLTGTVVDANPLDPAAPEAVPAAQVKLARRTARTGDDGSYVLDARLRMGANPLEVDRPGVERTVVTAEVAQATGGSVTVTVKDAAGATLGTATTAGAPDMSTALALALDPIAVVVHKIRGTVTWPDSRDDAPGYAGTPLQQRRVYALPLAPGPTVPQRPRHTSDWSRLKHDPRVLRSTRPGRYAHDEPTAADGAWEIRFVDLSLGAAHLVWTESPDPDEPGGSSPDYLVRTFHASLTWLTGPETTLAAAAGPGGNQMTLANAALFAAGQRVVVGDDDAQEGARIQNIAGNVVTVQTEAATGNFARAHAAGGSVSLAAGDASRRASRGHHLIDHTFNLLRAAAADRTAWGLDVIRVVDWEADPSHPDPGTTDPRMIRPARGADPAAFDEAVIGTGSTVEQLTFDPARRLATDVRLHSVPLVPRAEPVDRQSPAARRAAAGLEAAADAQFPRGHLTQHVPFVLDARRIDSGIDLVNPPPPAWDPTPATGDDELRARRRCELLEQTHVVTPQLPGRVFDPPAPPSGVTDVYWYSDAISLADGAWIQIPDPAPAPARAVIANRYLESNWVAVIEPVLPRLVALAANRTLMLAPGHGLYADPGTASDAPADRFRWESQRGGWHWRAGEDDNDVLMAREVDRVAVANGLAVENVREVRDLVRIGVTHTGVDRWTASGRIDFLRLWQQNPVYYLGHVRDPPLPAARQAVRGTPRGTTAGDKNGHGVTARARLAEVLATDGTLDVMLAVHTNAIGRRGGLVEYLDLRHGGAEENTIGEHLATQVARELRARCRTVGPANPNARTLTSIQGSPVRDLQDTFDYWTADDGAGPDHTDQWPRALAAGGGALVWQHETFARRARVALAEVAFHSRSDDAALLTRAWFRRRAGEAMAFAVETALRAAWPAALGPQPSPATRADLVRLLTAAFGRTSAIAALSAAPVPIPNAAAIDADVQAASGSAVAQPATGAGLDDAARAVEQVRDAHTRGMLFELVHHALAAVAGYLPADPEYEQYPTEAMTGGAPFERAGKPPTRADAVELVAMGVGLRPATLDTLAATPLGGAPLIDVLADGTPGLDRFLPLGEAQTLGARLRALQPADVYRVVGAYLADAHHDRLPAAGAPGRFSVAQGSEVKLVVETAGVPWRAAPGDVKFAISDAAGFSEVVDGEMRAPERLGSAAWKVTLPKASGFRRLEIQVSVKHRTAGMRAVGSRTVELAVT